MHKILKIYADSYQGLSSSSWMLALVMLINRSGSMVLPFLGVYMGERLHFTLEQSGYVLSCFGVGSIIGSSLGGWLTDKIGSYKVQLFSLFLSVPAFILLPFFESVLSLALMMLLQSTISEMLRPANSVAITTYAKPENITRAFSLNRMAVNLGFSIGPTMGGILAAISYPLLFYVNAGAYFIAGIVFFVYFRAKKTNRPECIQTIPETHTSPERSPYKDRMFLVFSFFCTVYAIVFLQLFNTLPLFYKDIVGMSKFDIGIILGYSGLLIFLLEMLLVHLADKTLSIKQTIVLGVGLSAIGFGILTLNHGLWVMYISMTFLCVSEILAMPFTSTVTALRAGPKSKGAYMGVNGMTFAIGFIVSPLLSTKIAHQYGYDTLWILTALMGGIAAIGLGYSVKKMVK